MSFIFKLNLIYVLLQRTAFLWQPASCLYVTVCHFFFCVHRFFTFQKTGLLRLTPLVREKKLLELSQHCQRHDVRYITPVSPPTTTTKNNINWANGLILISMITGRTRLNDTKANLCFWKCLKNISCSFILAGVSGQNWQNDKLRFGFALKCLHNLIMMSILHICFWRSDGKYFSISEKIFGHLQVAHPKVGNWAKLSNF